MFYFNLYYCILYDLFIVFNVPDIWVFTGRFHVNKIMLQLQKLLIKTFIQISQGAMS